MKPLKYTNDIPVFTKSQMDDYGDPEDWGYSVFEIIEDRDDMQFLFDFKLLSSYHKRPIHRYSRKKRFFETLAHIVGDRGTVPSYVLLIVEAFVQLDNDLWNQIRKILKQFKLRIYYNRIPFIIHHLTSRKITPRIHANQYNAIVQDYDQFVYWFEKEKVAMNRQYFPNMRFLVLKMLEKHNIQLQVQIPLARTIRKRKELEDIWNAFISR